MTRDPLGYGQSRWNHYTYTGSRPLVWLDPRGLEPEWKEYFKTDGKLYDEGEPEWYIPGITYEKHVEYTARVRHRCVDGDPETTGVEIVSWEVVGEAEGIVAPGYSAQFKVVANDIIKAVECENGGQKLKVSVTVGWLFDRDFAIPLPWGGIGIPVEDLPDIPYFGDPGEPVVLDTESWSMETDCCCEEE